MRSDFIGECAQFPNLTQMINDSHYLIPQMTRDQKRLAIEGPVAVGGGTITGRLSQQLLNDVGDNPDHLPVLQHALMRTWQYWVENKRSGESMDLIHYNAIGTLKEALSQHADEAYDQLSRRERQICEVMFKALTERGSENQGIRRPTKLHTIAKIAGVTEDEVVNVINKFREPGRSLLMPPHGVPLGSESVIDISHESLMRIWDRLKQWLDEESKSSEMYLKLSESAEKYQEGKSGLWQMPDLQLALNWEEENKPTLVWGQRYNLAYERTMIFLETSKKAYETEQRNKEILQKKQIKRTKVIAAILSVATLVLLTAVILAVVQSTEAKKQEELAKVKALEASEAAARADRLKEKAELQAAKAVDAEAAALLEKEKAEDAYKQADAARLDAEKQKRLAQDNETKAKVQQELAVKAAKRAKDAQLNADNERRNAQEAKDKAEDLRYQSIALSMAIKSKGIKDQDLKALVSRQAYVFWDEYKEVNEAFSGDIYSGVYYGLKGLKGDSLNMLIGHDNAVRSVVFDKGGESLYSAGSDGKILVWDLETETSSVLFRNDNVSRVVGISSNEKYLALGSDEDDIFLFDLEKPSAEPKKITGHGGAVFDLIFLPDNTGFISTGADQTIRTSDFKTSELFAKVPSRIKTLAIGPKGKFLAGGSENGEVWIFDMENPTAEPILLLEDRTNPV
ncbi:MAG: High-affnity carbon uptake protein Hat/HatR, partial [Bacteroidota bacterium]